MSSEPISAQNRQPAFKMPSVKLLDRVLVSSKMPFSSPLTGFVYAVYDNSVDVMLMSEAGFTRIEDCIHIDDPRLVTEPDIINRFTARGVFKLAESEQTAEELRAHIQTFADRFSNLEATLEKHAIQLAALQRATVRQAK